jgi:uncharacterized protein YndB with AHSA1/START domain
MTTVTGSIEIARPVEEVFDFVADERNEPSYNEEMVRCEKISPGPIGVGTTYEADLIVRGRTTPMTIEVTDFDPPHRLESWSRVPKMDIHGAVIFEPISGGTRMSWKWDLTPRGPLRLLGPLVTMMGRRQEERIWTSLKKLLESEALPG